MSDEIILIVGIFTTDMNSIVIKIMKLPIFWSAFLVV